MKTYILDRFCDSDHPPPCVIEETTTEDFSDETTGMIEATTLIPTLEDDQGINVLSVFGIIFLGIITIGIIAFTAYKLKIHDKIRQWLNSSSTLPQATVTISLDKKPRVAFAMVPTRSENEDLEAQNQEISPV